MSARVIYADSLIELTEDSILLRDYYSPFGSKRVGFADIDYVLFLKPTLLTGEYRFYGTGDFRTWFAPDWSRNSRDTIFVIHPRRGWWRMGFTVQDSKTVKGILRESGLPVVQGQ
jgi:hypothetical protein